MLFAGVPSSAVTRICLTHFHGDHCLGVPGVVQRMSLDRVAHPVAAHFPASGREYFARLRAAPVFHDVLDLREQPDRKSTRLNSSHANISYAVFCLKKKRDLPVP